MSSCKSCGSVLVKYEIQMRAADEPQTEVTSCPNCPVDPNKIEPNAILSSPFTPLKKLARRSLSNVSIRRGSTRTVYNLIVDIPKDHRLMNVELSEHHLVQTIPYHSRSSSDPLDNIPIKVTKVIKGPFEEYVLMYSNTSQIGANVRLTSYTVIGRSSNASTNATIKGYYSEQEFISHKTYVYKDYGSNCRQLLISLDSTQATHSALKRLVSSAYGNGLLPKSLLNYVGVDKVSTLSNLSARAWDASSPPEGYHMFTCKPDGQRSWFIWIGNVWYLCKPKCQSRSGEQIEWTWSKTRNTADTVVLDVEDMRSHGNILIDCLTDENGNPSPVSRNIAWCIETSAKIKSKCPELPLRVRQYFDKYIDAVTYSSAVPYATDGVVAIRNDSTEILKIKDVRSMELSLGENGNLHTADGDIVLTLPEKLVTSYDACCIIEVRFVLKDNKTIHMTDTFPRVDKTTANSTEAVTNIIRSAGCMSTADDNERRVALLWCNSLRQHLYKLAVNIKSSRSIILDIGTGTGQSLDAILMPSHIAYIFVEPDLQRCHMIASRFKLKKILTVTDIPSMIRSLKTRLTNCILVNSRLSDILENSRIADVVFAETRCITSVFSMQYVAKDLHYISATYGTPIIGCAYTYDKRDGDILVQKCGVTMEISNETTAVVKWGRDKQYTEPVTYSRDYIGLGNVVSADQVKNLPSMNIAPGANEICNNITVVS